MRGPTEEQCCTRPTRSERVHLWGLGLQTACPKTWALPFVLDRVSPAWPVEAPTRPKDPSNWQQLPWCVYFVELFLEVNEASLQAGASDIVSSHLQASPVFQHETAEAADHVASSLAALCVQPRTVFARIALSTLLCLNSLFPKDKAHRALPDLELASQCNTVPAVMWLGL